jgi:peptidoglycan/xylan/chitin deacetylase (PgdA/CDA1 family)
MKNILTIVMYHYIRPIKNSKYPGINGLELEDFINQMDYIKNYYNVITISDYIEAEKSRESLPNNSLVLSFDDGYLDHFQHVMPVLDKLKMKGVFFPVGKPCIENSIIDVNKIHFILNSTRDYSSIIQLLEKNIISDYAIHQTKNILFYRNSYFKKNRFDSAEVNYIKRLLQVGLPYKLRHLLVEELFMKYVTKDEKDFANNLYLNINQLKIMKNMGMEIGSHGYEHFWLDSLSMEDQILDINKSLKFLNSIKSKSDKFIFCYPYGAYNKNTLKILKNNNCEAAFTTKVGLVNNTINNILELPRIDTNDLPQKKKAKISKWTNKVIK